MLDTKLKNLSKAKRTGIIITVLAATAFTALLPAFRNEAAKNRQRYEVNHGINELETEGFIRVLVQSNYALFKNVMDKGSSQVYTYEDLYMEEHLEEVEEQSVWSGESNNLAKEADNVSEDSLTSLKETADYKWKYERITGEYAETSVLGLYVSQIQQAAEMCESYLHDIGTGMDYYVVDKNSGTRIKNTSLPIENLLLPEYEGDTDNRPLISNINAYYPYYVIMDYNEYGYLQNIKVKGTDSDQLLKTVRSVEGSKDGRLLTEREEIENYAVYDDNLQKVVKLLTVSQKKPANVTFVYAITQTQFQQNVPTYFNYYNIVNPVYCLFLLGILAATLLLALGKPALLTGKSERKMPLEITAIAGIILWQVSTNLVTELINNIAEGYFGEWLDNGLPFQIRLWMKEPLEIGFCFLILTVLFGLYFFCCLELSDIIRDKRKYFEKRSLIWRFGAKTKNYGIKLYRNFKAEIVNADLDDDMTKLLRHLIFINFVILATASMLWFFGILVLVFYSLALYFICKKYLYKMQGQYGKLLKAANSIAEGKLDNTFEDDFGVFGSYKEALYDIQDGFKNAVDEEVKSQKMKTELITNVSHDLKTPLTAIITYVDLLKEENITDAQRKEYIDTLETKSLRLKILIEDLFEVSKANSGNVKLDRVPVDICHLLRQAYLEQSDKMEQAGLQVRFLVPEEKIILYLDSEKTYRIFENLYTNIIKYALPATRVFISMTKTVDGRVVRIELKNISAQEITGNPQDLTERFVRGDSSRNTEGSGLGLAIARSFTEIQGGRFRIEVDGDVFKAIIEWDFSLSSL